MCRNIKTLFNFDPPATDDEIRDAALQFVRKLSGTTQPSKRNEQAFDQAVEAIAASRANCWTAWRRHSIRAIARRRPPRRGPGAASASPEEDRMSFFPGNDPLPGDAFACDAIELMVIPNARDIGGFEVRRALPTAKRRLVGPFIFFDRMGPAILRAGQALDVRPHPHIGLSTVTYLFDGKIRHRNSLGTEMVIEPGDVNLMTAGRGIVHSERSPEELRGAPMSISGLQTWLALPDDKEEIDPIFENTAASVCPRSTRTASAAASSSARFPACARRSDRFGHALCRPQARARRQREHPCRCRGARDLCAGRRGVDRRRPLSVRPAAGVPAGRRDRRRRRSAARISCCSAAPRSAPSATSGGISCPPRRSASSRQGRVEDRPLRYRAGRRGRIHSVAGARSRFCVALHA